MNLHDAHIGVDTINALYSELNQLEARYGQYLEQESLVNEVESLRHSIEDCMKGSPEAADYLHEHGTQLLSEIKKKLDFAAEEQQRMLDETPLKHKEFQH